MRQLLDEGIDGSAYIVEQVGTLADAFGSIIANDYDAYVVDHYVGARTGFDLLTRVAEEGIQTPVVFVAGSGDHGTGVTAVAAGAACYVVEDGIDSETLRQNLTQAIDQKSALSQLSAAGVAIESTTPTKAQILSHIADRLRNPAAEILEAARDSLMYTLPAHTVESLAAIEDHANGLLTLANDLVDLSMLEAGHLDFAAAEFSLQGLVSNSRRLLDSKANGTPCVLVDQISPDVPDVLVGDPGRLRRIIARFVETVMARTLSDHILLAVSVEERNTETVTLRFGVTSAAAGESATSTDDAEGSPQEDRTVLGTPIAVETLSRMGGRVSVGDDDPTSGGIQFTIRLQMVTKETEAPQPEIRTGDVEQPILIIADAVGDRRSLVKALSDAGLPHVVAASVDDWIETRDASIDKPEMPILAVIKSAKDPFAEADRFTQRSPAEMPIVLISSSGRRGDAARCRHHGVQGYLAEPAEPRDFADIVTATLALAASGDTTTLVTRYWLRDGRPSLRVLVVDDSQTNRFLMTRMLEERGHSTTIATDGLEAIEMVDRADFDVVLMDLMMPGMDGLEATRLICERFADTPVRPHIVGVSAFNDELTRDRGRAAGMAAFLGKPIRPDDLFAAVEQLTPEATDVGTEPEAEVAPG
jgi:CheY-like chemotaxis protein